MNQQRSSNWSLTLNLKTVSRETADECIARARQAGWTVNGQLEEGEEGTLHYQLHVKTPQVRFGAVKRMFPTAHIEVARNSKALATYVKKEDTRVGEIPEQDENYVTATKLWLMIYQEFNTCDKEGWNMEVTDEVTLYTPNKQMERDPLAFFDMVMGRFIRRGYMVDILTTNPAIRSFWKKFWRDILYRSRAVIDRQTDRHEETQSVTVSTTTDGCASVLRGDQSEEDDDEEASSQSGSEASSDSGSGSEGTGEEDD